MVVLQSDCPNFSFFERSVRSRNKALAFGLQPLDISEAVTMRMEMNWIVGFGTIFDEFVRAIGVSYLRRSLSNVRESELDDLVHYEHANELGFTRKQLSEAFEKMKRIAQKATNRDETIYDLLSSSRRNKHFFFAFLLSSLCRLTGRKVFLYLDGMDLACLAVTHFLFSGIVISLLTMLSVVRGCCCIYLPCEREILKSIQDMREYANK